MMKDLRIKKSILSITSPGTYIVDHLGRETTRMCNEYAAGLKRDHPEQFGFWASLPLPDVTGSLIEIDYALDTLGAAGIALLTNHRGRYLGDPDFDPVFAELDKREAKVFIHPTTPCIKTNNGHKTCNLSPNWPSPISEYLFEDARGVMNLFLSGTTERYPNITFVISHGGGTLAPLIERFGTLPKLLGMDIPPHMDIENVKAVLRERFYFDLAGFAFPNQITGLLPYTVVDRLLYGTDYPYTPTKLVEECAKQIDKQLPHNFPNQSNQQQIYYGNAERLLQLT